MSVAYIFDVDGTLTPSRGTMDPMFKEWFLGFQSKNDVYLVTGSDRPKTLEQVGAEVVANSKLMFSCCGNEVWDGDDVLYQSDWKGTPALFEELENQLSLASFQLRTGQHIELRTGLVNFSVLGRGATKEQRREYVEYDNTRFERRSLISRLSTKFHDVEFAIAGETGIDIYPLGKDKSQVLRWIKADRTVFFGDAVWPGGNDHQIAMRCDEHHHVSGWEDTWSKLRESINR